MEGVAEVEEETAAGEGLIPCSLEMHMLLTALTHEGRYRYEIEERDGLWVY